MLAYNRLPMFRALLPVVLLLLAACTANLAEQGASSVLPTLIPPPEQEIQITGSGAEFFARFSTTGALNSRQSFVSSYHGEMRITVLPNKKIECRFWAEGRIENPLVYEGNNGFIEAFSTLCVGRLQQNGTFEFRGVYVSDDPIEEEVPDDTFTLSGAFEKERIRGALLMGGAYATDASLKNPSHMPTEQDGLRFEAVRTNP